MVEGSDDSKNSSDTDSPDNDASATMKQDKTKTEEKQHKRVHYQDHKLSAKNIKQHQKINRRLQRITEMAQVIVMVQATVMAKGAVVMEAVMVMEQATNGPDQVVILHGHLQA